MLLYRKLLKQVGNWNGDENDVPTIGVARILSEVHFFPQKKLTTIFLSSPLKGGLKLLIEAPNLPSTAKMP